MRISSLQLKGNKKEKLKNRTLHVQIIKYGVTKRIES